MKYVAADKRPEKIFHDIYDQIHMAGPRQVGWVLVRENLGFPDSRMIICVIFGFEL